MLGLQIIRARICSGVAIPCCLSLLDSYWKFLFLQGWVDPRAMLVVWNNLVSTEGWMLANNPPSKPPWHEGSFCESEQIIKWLGYNIQRTVTTKEDLKSHLPPDLLNQISKWLLPTVHLNDSHAGDDLIHDFHPLICVNGCLTPDEDKIDLSVMFIQQLTDSRLLEYHTIV